MKQYPIHVERKLYRGSKPNQRLKTQEYNAIAVQLEKIVNEIIEQSEDNEVQVSYHAVSMLSGYPVDTVRDVLFSVDGGHNGLTAFKR